MITDNTRGRGRPPGPPNKITQKLRDWSEQYPDRNEESIQEEWVEVIDWPDYEISNFGLIRRKTDGIKIKAGGLVSQWPWGPGYTGVSLNKDGQYSSILVHRLVWQSFNRRLKEKEVINHIDGVKTNNHLSNLEAITQSQNVLHGFYVLGRIHEIEGRKGEENSKAILKEEQVREIRRLRDSKLMKQKDVANKFGVSCSCVSDIVHRRTWKHLS